jgi:serine-type D-Ala-D-Ala carboxypeptidase (penicillin-binding protein 5/6)
VSNAVTFWQVRVLRLLVAVVLVAAVGAQHTPRPVVAEEIYPPEIYAENAIVLSDYNEILYEKNAHQRTAPASTTKMMTAIVAVRYGDLNMEVLIDESDIVGEASMGLWAGETVTMRGLLYGLLLPSGNDAAHAIARTIGTQMGGRTPEESVRLFVQLMNQTTREYQLRNTHFMNPHGLDEWGHYSTPFDLAIILRAALNYPIIREVMQTRAYHIDGHDLWNGNRLHGMRDDIIGGKTGFTEDALFCLAAAAWQDGRFAIAVVTRNDGYNWFYDVSNLLDYGLAVEQQRGVPTWVRPQLAGTQLQQSRSGILQGSP